MTHFEAESLVRQIFAKLVPTVLNTPSVVLSTRKSGGTAYRQGNYMSIGLKPHPMPMRDIIIHETAHHVDYRWYGRSDHSERFYRTLKAAIRDAGVALGDYAWHAEYVTLYDRAVRDGLTRQPHFRKAAKSAALAQFRIGSQVQFKSNIGRMEHGTIVRFTPNKACVRVGPNTWRVPFRCLLSDNPATVQAAAMPPAPTPNPAPIVAPPAKRQMSEAQREALAKCHAAVRARAAAAKAAKEGK